MLISGEKMLVSDELKRCVTWFIFFMDLLWVRHNSAKFHYCKICVIDFKEWETFLLPHNLWAATKRLILNKVKRLLQIKTNMTFFSQTYKEFLHCFHSFCSQMDFPVDKRRIFWIKQAFTVWWAEVRSNSLHGDFKV